MAFSIRESYGFFKRPLSADNRVSTPDSSTGPSTRNQQYLRSLAPRNSGTIAPPKTTSKIQSSRSTESRPTLQPPHRPLSLTSLSELRSQGQSYAQQVTSPNIANRRASEAPLNNLLYRNLTPPTALQPHLFVARESDVFRGDPGRSSRDSFVKSWQKDVRDSEALAVEERDKIEAELKQKSAEVEELRGTIKKASKNQLAEVKQKNAELEQLRANLKRAAELLTSTSKEMTDVRSKFDDTNGKYQRLLEEDSSGYKLQYQKLLSMIKDAMSKNEELVQSRATIEADAKSTLEVLQARQKDLESALQQRVGDLAEERDRRLRAEEKMEALRASQLALNADIAQPKDESISEINKRLHLLIEHIKGEGVFRGQVQQSMSCLQEFVRTTETQFLHSQERSLEELKKVKESLEREQRARKEAESRLQNVKASAVDEVEEQNSVLIGEMEKQLDSLQQQNRLLEQTLQSRELSLELQLRDLDSERSKAYNLSRENADLKKDKSNLQKSVQTAQQHTDELASDIVMLKSDILRLQADIEHKSRAARRQQLEKETLQKRCAVLEDSATPKQEPVITVESDLQPRVQTANIATASMQPARPGKRSRRVTSSDRKSSKRLKKNPVGAKKDMTIASTAPKLEPQDSDASSVCPGNGVSTLVSGCFPNRARLSSLRPRRSTRP